MTDDADVLLIGAGDLGTEIGLCLAAAGHGTVALRRRAELVTPPLHGVAGDVRSGLPAVADMPTFTGPGGGPRLLVICLTAGGREATAYRSIFLDAVAQVLDDMVVRGWAPERALFVSSTGVCASHGPVDEGTPPAPESVTSQVLLEAERQFLAKLPSATAGTVVRPSGLYGPGREWFITQVRRGQITNPRRMTHRIHRDDAAAAIAHLMTMDETPQELYLLTDDAPVPAGEVAAFIADRLGLSPDAEPAAPRVHDGAAEAPEASEVRRLDNARLRSTGFEFRYPSYREGYSAIIDGHGVRHP